VSIPQDDSRIVLRYVFTHIDSALPFAVDFEASRLLEIESCDVDQSITRSLNVSSSHIERRSALSAEAVLGRGLLVPQAPQKAPVPWELRHPRPHPTPPIDACVENDGEGTEEDNDPQKDAPDNH